MPVPLRLGTVPFLNARPLVEGLRDVPGTRLVHDVPSRLAARLRAGELDAALVSAVELFRAPPLAWWPGAAIASRGPVRSILLFVRGAPRAITSVALDTSSLTAAALTRVCLSDFLGCNGVELLASDPGVPVGEVDADAVLRIGDAALAADPAGRQVLDLGELWTDSTGLPFVYAAWLARPGAPAGDMVGRLAAARDLGLPRRAEVARAFARLHARDPAPCVEYLLRCIRYEFGDAEREGLEHFGQRARAHGLVDTDRLPAPLR